MINDTKDKFILFVCTGNTCRSPMAEALCAFEVRRLHLKGVRVASAGVAVKDANFVNPKSAKILSENGLTLSNFSSKQITRSMLLEATAIICMSKDQRDYLRECKIRLGIDGDENVFAFSDIVGYDIPDPYGLDENAYRETFDKIAGGMGKILSRFVGVEEKAEQTLEKESLLTEDKPKPKKRGRKPSAKPKTEQKTDGAPKKRGRPRKNTGETKTPEKTQNKE